MAAAASRFPPDFQPSERSRVEGSAARMTHSGGRTIDPSPARTSGRRRRLPSDEADAENETPPAKRTRVLRDSDSDSSPASSSPSSSADGAPSDGAPSDGAPSDDSDGRPRSGESSPRRPRRLGVPPGVLAPLDNLVEGRPRKRGAERRGGPEKRCPLPALSWADPVRAWDALREKDSFGARRRSPLALDNHPGLKRHMRSILLDWLIEVAAVYKLQRETFHLCVDYLDRYLNVTEGVHKNHLQLLGITCLFIAAKLTEIYPPKVADFAYVTDGACSREDIVEEEKVVLMALEWKITSMTAIGWLNLLLQLGNDKFSETTDGDRDDVDGLGNYTFMFAQYSSLDFVTCAQLIDLALFDVEVNSFRYRHVAAAAIAHSIDRDLAVRVSGVPWEELERCHAWMSPFARVLSSGDDGENVHTLPTLDSAACGRDGLSNICPDINPESSHRLQVRNVTIGLFEKAEEYRRTVESCNESGSSTDSEDPKKSFPMTPPDSSHKRHARRSQKEDRSSSQ